MTFKYLAEVIIDSIVFCLENHGKQKHALYHELMRPFLMPQVCELDIIFNFEKAYFMLDELLLGGEVQETSKKNVLKAIAAQDLLQEVSSLSSSFLFSAG